ncbi:MAG: hypothetical protein NTY20_01340 [Candidatus Aenigmarchaeota archaeon]|nr:hypothetical protein [Candidatus Aenigmarchaeota archaeon]
MDDNAEYQGVIISKKGGVLTIIAFPYSIQDIFDSYLKKGNWEREDIVGKTWLEAPTDEKTIFRIGRKMRDSLIL